MLIALAAALCLLAWQTPSTTYEDGIAQWRQQRLVDAAGPQGWTTVVALHWLRPGRWRVGGGDVEIRLPGAAPPVIGTFEVSDREVRFGATPGVEVTSDGKRVASLAVIPDETRLEAGSYTLSVIARGSRLGLRVRDSDSAARRAFQGIETFTVSARYRLRARFEPFTAPKTASVVNVIGDAVDFVSPGQVVFTLDGREHRLDALYETSERKDLWLIFKDLTSGSTTYPAGRYLHVPLPKNGIVDLDFNLAYNPPCAFTEFATCPIPPRQNWLKVGIEAGEKAYH